LIFLALLYLNHKLEILGIFKKAKNKED